MKKLLIAGIITLAILLIIAGCKPIGKAITYTTKEPSIPTVPTEIAYWPESFLTSTGVDNIGYPVIMVPNLDSDEYGPIVADLLDFLEESACNYVRGKGDNCVDQQGSVIPPITGNVISGMAAGGFIDIPDLPDQPDSCQDTDDEYNDNGIYPNIAGVIYMYTSGFSSNFRPDTCVGTDQILEHYCNKSEQNITDRFQNTTLDCAQDYYCKPDVDYYTDPLNPMQQQPMAACVYQCNDSMKNYGESDTDCGGNNTCPRCEEGDDCTVDNDCDSGLVCIDDVCAELCTDSDGNTATSKGTTSGATDANKAFNYTDYCPNTGQVFEFTCDTNTTDNWGKQLIDCGTNEMCRDGLCFMPNYNTPYNCLEADSGDNPLSAGQVTSLQQGSCIDYDDYLNRCWEYEIIESTSPDVCTGNTLKEYYCTPTGTRYREYTCDSCSNGACTDPQNATQGFDPQLTTCGNGQIDTGEQCDPGNPVYAECAIPQQTCQNCLCLFNVTWTEEPPTPEANITVNKTANSTNMTVNGTITYTITITNTGTANLTGVTLTELYPAIARFVSATPAPDAGNDTWNFNLTAGQTITINITINATSSGNMTNTVNVTFDNQSVSDSLTTQVTAPAPTIVEPTAQNSKYIYRCRNNATGDHFPDEFCNGTNIVKEYMLGIVYTSQQSGTIPLYVCLAGQDHFVSPDPNCEVVQTQGQLLGYAFTQASGTGTIPVHRCYSATGGDHMLSHDQSCETTAYTNEATWHFVRACANATDTNCGGPRCPACGVNKSCNINTDCEAGLNCVFGTCLAPEPAENITYIPPNVTTTLPQINNTAALERSYITLGTCNDNVILGSIISQYGIGEACAGLEPGEAIIKLGRNPQQNAPHIVIAGGAVDDVAAALDILKNLTKWNAHGSWLDITQSDILVTVSRNDSGTWRYNMEYTLPDGITMLGAPFTLEDKDIADNNELEASAERIFKYDKTLNRSVKFRVWSDVAAVSDLTKFGNELEPYYIKMDGAGSFMIKDATKKTGTQAPRRTVQAGWIAYTPYKDQVNLQNIFTVSGNYPSIIDGTHIWCYRNNNWTQVPKGPTTSQPAGPKIKQGEACWIKLNQGATLK